MNDRFRVGVITDKHGIKGEVKVYPTTEDPLRFSVIPFVYAVSPDGDDERVLHIERARQHKDRVILKVKESDNANIAEELRKYELFVDRENAVPLNDGEYYVADLIGLKVYDEDEAFLGELTDVIQTGANDVYEVSAQGRKPLYIPAIKQCILSVDIEGGTMRVHLLDGLTEL